MDTNNILFCKDLGSGTITSINAVNNNTVFMNPRFLSGLSDVSITTPLTRQLLLYNGTIGKWNNEYLYLSTLGDVNLTGVPENNDYIKWDTTQAKWINRKLQYAIINNYGKLNESLFTTTLTYYAIMANSTLTTTNITFDSLGLTVDPTDGSITGWRTTTNYLIEYNISFTVSSITNTGSYLSIAFSKDVVNAGNTTNFAQCGLVNSVKNYSLSNSVVFGALLSTTKIFPAIAMNTSFVGITPNDFNMSVVITEI